MAIRWWRGRWSRNDQRFPGGVPVDGLAVPAGLHGRSPSERPCVLSHTTLDRVGELQRSSRDPDQLRRRLEVWLATKLPPDAAPVIGSLEGTSANGMSSETLLFDAEWTRDGARCPQRLVARVAPDAADVPVFPSYDLDRQFQAIGLVGRADDRAGAAGVVVGARPRRRSAHRSS